MFDDEDEDDGDDGGSWHSFIEVYETSVTIEKLAHLDGTTLRTGMKIGMGGLEANLMQDVGDPFNGAKKGEMDYSGFTGNEGGSAKHWYRKTVCDFTGMPIWTFANRLSFQVAVIVSNDSIDEFLIQGITKSGAQSLLPQYLSKVDDPATAESGWKMVKHLAELSWSSSHGVSAGSYYSSYEVPRLDLEVAKEFFRATLSHGKYELFGSTLGYFLAKELPTIAMPLTKELPTIAMPLFEIVGSAALSESLDFAQIKDRYVFFRVRRGYMCKY